jgi:hypothetical protein
MSTLQASRISQPDLRALNASTGLFTVTASVPRTCQQGNHSVG